MQRSLPLFVLLLFVACASGGGGRPNGIPQPGLEARLTNEVFFGSGNTAPANVEVLVTNRGTVPIEVRHIEISTPGMVQWRIIPTRRDFRQTIAPGETRALTVFGTAETITRRPSEPVTIRAIVDFAAGKDRWREYLMIR